MGSGIKIISGGGQNKRLLLYTLLYYGASRVALAVKNLPASSKDKRDTGLIPMLEKSIGGENGNPLQYSCLENPMDRRV